MEPSGREPPSPAAISLAGKLAEISRHWSPRTIATVNDYEVRLARARGQYLRHQHPDSDEFFLVVAGELTLDFDDGSSVILGPDEMYVVRAGVYHRPVAHIETSILLFERSNLVQTGSERGSLTATRAQP
jgi:mannose-6-phosphate isomerase-like protein (cupin superfamily)